MERKTQYEFSNDELFILAEALDLLIDERRSHSYWINVHFAEVTTAEHMVRVFKGDRF